MFEKIVFAAYFATLLVLAAYGCHRYVLVFLLYRYRRQRARGPEQRFAAAELPKVTIQLPVFNERYVVDRLIDAVAALDYPRERLEVQVLDDSTDDTTEIAARKVEEWRAKGLDIVLIHRTDRTGYKAGALENGLKHAQGELVAIFDADFVPDADFLMRTVHYFTKPEVGLVQMRWGHLNRDYSLLTRAQAVLLDGHFVVESPARFRAGRFFNFNGTAGIWRKRAIEEAGGWEHDTLTEDMDLSYRAQMRGWRFVYLDDLTAPAELPAQMAAFKTQQHRWAKGQTQTCLKLFKPVMNAELPFKIKLEAFFHLTGNFCYLLMVLLSMLMLPMMLVRIRMGDWELGYFFDMSLFMAASVSVIWFYAVSQYEGYKDWKSRLWYFPLVLALGIGMCINNTRAVLEALFGHESPFVRTPKHAIGAGDARKQGWRGSRYVSSFKLKNLLTLVELGMGAYFVVVVAIAFWHQLWVSGALLSLFMIGFFWVGGLTLVHSRGKDSAPAEPAGATEIAAG